MKIFKALQVREAIAYAAKGGQALHLHQIIVNRDTAPRCFVAAVDRGEYIAHLFDQDKERLVKTARRHGVKVIYIDKEDTPRQHIDLCAGPLRAVHAWAKQQKAFMENKDNAARVRASQKAKKKRRSE